MLENRMAAYRCAVASMLIASAWWQAVPAHASGLPKPEKIIAAVRSKGCDAAGLRSAIGAVTSDLVKDRRISRVAVDWPAEPERNLDLAGNPSPFAAMLEVSASRSSLSGIARTVADRLGPTCKVAVYLVAERRLLTRKRSWPLGTPSPDAKTLTTQIRKAGLSRHQFDAEWSGPHARLALAWREAAHLTDGHYVQNVVVGRIGRDAPAIDGIGEGERAITGTAASQALRQKTAEHGRTFLDLANTEMFVASEVILKD